MKQQVKIEFTIGIELDKTGNPVSPSTVERFKEAFGLQLCASFGGFSLTAVDGGYTHKDGKLAIEKSLIFSVLTTEYSINLAETLARKARVELNQESVLLSWTPTSYNFI